MVPLNFPENSDSSPEIYVIFTRAKLMFGKGSRTRDEPPSALRSATSQYNPEAAFASPDNAVDISISAATNISKMPILSQASLQYDGLCMTSTTLQPLLRKIWDYSSAEWSYPETSIEGAAGHRYWLPNGWLADEWVYFFQLAPDRFLKMAPESVRAAFKTQTDDSLLVGPSFADAIQAQAIEHEKSETEANFCRMIGGSPELHPLEISSQDVLLQPLGKDSFGKSISLSEALYPPMSQEVLLDVTKISSRKRLRDTDTPHGNQSGDESGASSNGRSPKRTRRATSDLWTRQLLRQNPQRAASSKIAASASTNVLTQRTTGYPVIVPAVAAPATPHVFPLNSDPTGAVAFIPDQAALSTVGRLLQSHSVHPPMKLPGGALPTGSQSRAWSAQRIRTWVEIENKPLSRLPSTAFSAHGNEMTNFRTPESIDPRCCPFETSIEENFAYFPNTCTINREMCFRASKHWSPMMIARYIIAYQFASMDAFAKKHAGLRPTASLQSNSTESGLKAPNNNLHDYFLFHMGDGVVRPPTGRGAQMLTRVIEHIRNVTGDRNVQLSQAATYARTHGITVPAEEQMDFKNLDAEDKPSLALIVTAMSDYRNKFGEDEVTASQPCNPQPAPPNLGGSQHGPRSAVPAAPLNTGPAPVANPAVSSLSKSRHRQPQPPVTLTLRGSGSLLLALQDQTPLPILPHGRRLGLRPAGEVGKYSYEWSDGRKLAWSLLQGGPLPDDATAPRNNPHTSRSTWHHIDLRLTGMIPITIVEILTVIQLLRSFNLASNDSRLRDGGWAVYEIREFIFWSRNIAIHDLEALKRPTMQRQITADPEWILETNNQAAGYQMASISTDRSRNESTGVSGLTDCLLVSLAEGVVHFPQGVDRGLLSVAVKHAVQRHHEHVWFSQLEEYVHHFQLIAPATFAATAAVQDRAALDRLFRSGNRAVRSWWEANGYTHDR
ncbi:hypothetical protein DDE83_004378 [Stemphylium lycopersici]|uniref:Uncharacterized protein n=1 Tax=Stemphylium lycopersici TaxID=183478 RepID=A0A364N4R6_STELY|nr:hypothetical protein DDE83_004378 [Stemphylium lycopersici]